MNVEPPLPPGQGHDDSGTVPPPNGGQPVPGHDGPSPHDPHITGYNILRCINKGGQGEVYEAVQMSTGGPVAIKVLKRSLYHSSEAKRNLAQEIRLLVQLRQPHIIEVKDAGETSDGRLYFIMEFFPGVSLKDYIRKQKITLVPALQLFRKVCEAIRFVHERGVVHLDLKPANILVDAQGMPKILDFGLARTLFTPHEMSQSDIAGTLPYMSPEQTRLHIADIDARSDVYSLGIILYEMLVGQYPYPINGAMSEILERIAEAPPMNPRVGWTRQLGIRPQPEAASSYECPIDFELEAIVLKTLAKDPAARYQTAGDLALNVQRYLDGKPVDPILPNLAYVLFTRFRSFVRRHRITAFVLTLLFAVSLTEAIFGDMLWTKVNLVFERTLARTLSSGEDEFQDIRVIGITDRTDFDALARLAKIEGEPGDLRIGRALHGRLLTRLAQVKCKAIAFDLMLSGPSEYDQEFIEGVNSLREARADVVIARDTWWPSRSSYPPTSPAIEEKVTTIGCAAAYFDHRGIWNVPLLVKSNSGGEPAQSLALAGAISYLRRDRIARVTADWEESSIDLDFSEGEPALRIPMTKVQEVSQETAIDEFEFGLVPRDRMGLYKFSVPSDPKLALATDSYEDVFSFDTEELIQRFENKLVVIGNMRCAPGTDCTKGCDCFDHPDGRTRVWGCHGHAAAMNAILTNSGFKQFGRFGEASLSMVGSLLGCMVALRHSGRRGSRALALTGLTAGFILVSVTAYWRVQFLWNPIVAIMALWVAGETYALVHRIGESRRGWS